MKIVLKQAGNSRDGREFTQGKEGWTEFRGG